MSNIYIPSGGPAGWKSFLADPEKQWRAGYSARTVAHSWEAARGMPIEIQPFFEADAEMLFGFPEHKTPLPGGGRPSQSDIFLLVREASGLVATCIEGKVDETFGPLVNEWLVDASQGKQQRIAYLCGELGVGVEDCGALRYQLFHRSVAALIEADRFHASRAAMIVHSFSPENRWKDEFEAFCVAIHAKQIEPCRWVLKTTSVPLTLGWASGDQSFRNA